MTPRRRSQTSAAGALAHNADIAAAFEEIAELLAIQGENPFRIRAYERAAQVIRSLPQPLAELHGTQAFDALPGIGPDLAAKIQEMLRTGSLDALQRLRRQVPAGLRELLRLPGLGPVRVRALHSQLGIGNRTDLAQHVAAGDLGRVRGFGPGLQARLEAALRMAAPDSQRMPRSIAAEYAVTLQRALARAPSIGSVEVAGSYRRARDTVGDLDFVVTAPRGLDLADLLRHLPEVANLAAEGPTRCTATLRNGLQADFRCVEAPSRGAALLYFTGSRNHNIRLRRRAQERGLKLNEYGLFRGTRRIAGKTEAEVYAALSLPFIPPELREDRGEIEAAEAGRLPRLICRGDLRGDLHAHTTASDGREPLATLVAAAQARGLEYVAVTDHASALGALHGMTAGRLARQADAIDALNARLKGITVLKGAEVDILADGSLALPDAVLARLDIVVIAVHGHFDLPERQQTTRLLRAINNRHASILAHPTGRLIGDRAPSAFDIERVLVAARECGCALELNCQPSRLDLDDVYCRAARDHGVRISIASDAHAGADFALLENGIGQARRGWLTRADVLNAKPLASLRRWLGR